jgi:hypothetical protein
LYAKEKGNVNEFLDKVQSINPDLILCGGTYGDIPEEVKSKYKCVNLYHPNQKTIPHNQYITDALKIIRDPT